MNIRTPTSPGIEPFRFLPSDDAANSLAGRHGLAGTALDHAPVAGADASLGADGEAVLAMNVWDGADSRSLQASVPPSVGVSNGADVGESVERAVDYVLSPLS